MHNQRGASQGPGRLAGEERPADALSVLEKLSAEPRFWALARARTADIQYAEGKMADAFRTVDEVVAKQPEQARARVEQRLQKTPKNSAVRALAGRVWAATGDTAKGEPPTKEQRIPSIHSSRNPPCRLSHRDHPEVRNSAWPVNASSHSPANPGSSAAASWSAPECGTRGESSEGGVCRHCLAPGSLPLLSHGAIMRL